MRHRSRRDHTPHTQRTPAKRRRHQRVTRYRPSHAEPERFEPPQSSQVLEVIVPYTPTIVSGTDAAHKGVRLRLFGAATCGVIAAMAAASLLMFSFHPFALLMVCVIAGAFALVTITLAMSARKEEEVHQLAASLSRQPSDEPLPLCGETHTDGTL